MKIFKTLLLILLASITIHAQNTIEQIVYSNLDSVDNFQTESYGIASSDPQNPDYTLYFTDSCMLDVQSQNYVYHLTELTYSPINGGDDVIVQLSGAPDATHYFGTFIPLLDSVPYILTRYTINGYDEPCHNDNYHESILIGNIEPIITSTNNLSTQLPSIYPNPCTNTLTISNILEPTLYNSSGQLIIPPSSTLNNITTINTEYLTPGLYIIHSPNSTHKIIKL